MILCVDYPLSERLLEAIRTASRDPRVRIVEVRPTEDWLFAQAYVRRSGFRASKYERILTGDVDIVVNKNCLKAVERVGEENIGIVSMSKRRGAGTLGELVRNVSKKVVKVMRRRAYFTGLYALYRPYWLDTEIEEEVRKIPHPDSPGLLKGDAPYLGEDLILRNYMKRKHKVVYLPDVGGTDLRVSLEDRPSVQMKLGERFFHSGRRLTYVLTRSILYARGTMLGVYCDLLVREGGLGLLLMEFFLAILLSPKGAFTSLQDRAMRRRG